MVKSSRAHWVAPIILVLTAILGYLSMRDPFQMQSYMERWTYPIMMLNLLLLIFALLPFLARADLRNWSFARRGFQALAVGLLFTAFFFSSIKPSFKLFADESNLLTTSESLYRFKSAKIISGQIVQHGNADVVETLIPKQPYLFSFLLAQVHNLVGYSVNNGFVLNGLLCILFSALLYYVFAPWGFSLGLSAILLWFATPITAMTVTSADFTFLFFVMLFVLTFLVAKLREGWSQEIFFLFWICSVLTVHTRYEAIALIGILWLIALYKKIIPVARLRENIVPLCSTILLALPFIWQQGIYWTRFGGGHTEYNGVYKKELFGTFSFRYWLPNLKMFFDSVLSPFSNHPFSPIIYALALLAVLYFVIKRLGLAPADDSRRRVFFHFKILMALCLVHFAILMTYFFGEAGYPSTARYFMGLVSFLSVWPVLAFIKFGSLKYRPHFLVFSLLSFFYVHAYAQSSAYRNNIFQVKTFYWFRDNYLPLLNDKAMIVHDYSVNIVMLHKSAVSNHVFNLGWRDFRNQFKSGRLQKLYTLEIVDPNQPDLRLIHPELLARLDAKLIDRTDIGLGVRANLYELSFKDTLD